MSFSTGIFDANIGNQQNPNSTVVFNNRLWYIGNGSDTVKKNIWANYFNLSKILSVDFLGKSSNEQKDILKEGKNWKGDELPQDSTTGKNASTANIPAVVVVNNTMYVIWTDTVSKDDKDTSNKVYAISATPDGNDVSWSSFISIKTPSDELGGENEELTTKSDLSAYIFNNKIVLSWIKDRDGGKSKLVSMVLDPATIKNNIWVGEEGSVVDFDILGFDESTNLSTTWFSQMPTKVTVENKKNKTTFTSNDFMMVSSYNNKSNSVFLSALPMDSNGLPVSTAIKFSNITSKSPASLAKDPAGRVRVYYLDNNGKMMVKTVDASNRISANSWAPDSDNFPITNSLSGQQIMPAFVLFPPRTTTISNTATQGGKTVNLDPATVTVQVYQIYEFVFSTERSNSEAENIQVQVNDYGAIWAAPESINIGISSTDPTNPAFVITGIFDGPPPVPIENIFNFDTGTSAAQNLASVSYGIKTSQGSEFTTESSVVKGSISSAGFSAGIGPAWDTSMKEGTGVVNSQSTISTVEENHFSIVNIYKKNGVNDIRGVLSQGTLFGGDITNISAGIFQYRAPADTPTTNSSTLVSSAPVFLTFTPSNADDDREAKPYELFSVQGATLTSYFPQSIDAKMLYLYEQYLASQKPPITDDNDPRNVFGEIASAIRSGYIENVITPKALELGVNNKFLQVAWSQTGEIIPGFSNISSSFVERSWTFESSFYTGISGGLSISVGAGPIPISTEVSFSYSDLSGIESSFSVTKTETESNEIGLNAQIIQIPGATFPGQVTSYSYRMYFLPSDNLWTQEILNFSSLGVLPNNINKNLDPNAAPWKIMFTVDPSSVTYFPLSMTLGTAVVNPAKTEIILRATTNDLTPTGTPIATATDNNNNSYVLGFLTPVGPPDPASQTQAYIGTFNSTNLSQSIVAILANLKTASISLKGLISNVTVQFQ